MNDQGARESITQDFLKGKEIEAVANVWLLGNLSIVNVTYKELGFLSVIWNRRRYMRFVEDYVGLKLMEHQVQTSVNEHELSSETTAQQRSRRKQVVQLMILEVW